VALSVSVALCTFNGARFVVAQAESILRQTALPLEVVLSDDGSSDGTVDRVREVFESHPEAGVSLVVLRSESPLGVTKNFERAVRKCRGDIIVLADQDDVWVPDRVADAVQAFEGRPDLLLRHGDARLVDEKGRPTGSTLLGALRVSERDVQAIAEGRAFETYIRRNIATGATLAFRRSLLEFALPFPVEWVHDEWLAIIAAATGAVELTKKPLIDYRQHSTNQIGVQDPTLRYRLRRMFQASGGRYEQLARRSVLLVDRLIALDVSAPILTLAEAKSDFERARALYPSHRAARLLPVTRQFLAGYYSTLSSQRNLDVVRDLVQPTKPNAPSVS
jgi:glycosyltransferase involved in cell wall biosynthesis